MVNLAWRHFHTEESKRKIGEKNKISLLGAKHSKESKEKVSKTMVRLWSNPSSRENRLRAIQSKENRTKISNSKKGKKLSEEHKLKDRIAIKKWWSNPENAKLRFEQIGIKPNKLEISFQKFLDEHFPGDWKYVGDGTIWIAGKCPDFWNMNGKKQIIELFGEYWHKPEDEQIRKDHFAQYGYKTLVIWESEFKNLEQVVEKIRNF